MSAIKIVKNKNLCVKQVKMTCDGRPDGLNPTLQWNFFSIIVGGPGSGKTNLIMNLIGGKKKGNRFFYKQFHKVFLFSPSFHTVKKNVGIPDDQIIPTFDLNKINEIVDDAESDENTLIIIDDMVASLKKNMSELLKIIFNRRHIGAGLSVIITAQKYNKIPLELRTGASSIFMFNKNKKELNNIFSEFCNLDRCIYDRIVRFSLDKQYDFLYMKLDEPECKKYYKGFDMIKFEESSDDY